MTVTDNIKIHASIFVVYKCIFTLSGASIVLLVTVTDNIKIHLSILMAYKCIFTLSGASVTVTDSGKIHQYTTNLCIYAIQAREKLIKRLFPLIISRQNSCSARFSNGVQFIEKHNRGCCLLSPGNGSTYMYIYVNIGTYTRMYVCTCICERA